MHDHNLPRRKDKYTESAPVGLIVAAEDGTRRCLSCKYFVAKMDSGMRRCKNPKSEHFETRYFGGCDLWECWL